jgi:hypothetical protein
METFYCVISSYDDRGRVTMAMQQVQAEKCPEDTCISTARKDIYKDFFRDRKEAEEFMNQAV